MEKEKLKFALYWAASCGGCEIAVLDINEKILDVVACMRGQCVMTCPSGAMTLVRKPEDQITSTPQNIQEWMMERADGRGISLQEIL